MLPRSQACGSTNWPDSCRRRRFFGGNRGLKFVLNFSAMKSRILKSMGVRCLSCGAPAVTPGLCVNCNSLQEELRFYRLHGQLRNCAERVLAWHDDIRQKGGAVQDSHKAIWVVALKELEARSAPVHPA